MNAIQIGEQPVREVMVPDSDIVALSTSVDFEENARRVEAQPQTRYLLVGEHMADFQGIIYTPILLKHREELASGDIDFEELAAPPMTMSPDTDVSDAIDQFQAEHQELALVIEASEVFQEWLDVQSRFHDYSYRNTLLIKQQCPGASRVAGYRTWQKEFDRHVKGGESAIWIWAPIITKRCPECENSQSYHENSDCEYDETSPEEWSKGLVGFNPAPVFDVSQTEGEPLPVRVELGVVVDGDGPVAVHPAHIVDAVHANRIRPVRASSFGQ